MYDRPGGAAASRARAPVLWPGREAATPRVAPVVPARTPSTVLRRHRAPVDNQSASTIHRQSSPSDTQTSALSGDRLGAGFHQRTSAVNGAQHHIAILQQASRIWEASQDSRPTLQVPNGSSPPSVRDKPGQDN